LRLEGTTHDAERQPRQRRKMVKRPTRTPGLLTPAVLRWFADRGISEEVVRRNRIGAARHWIPALKALVDRITFPYSAMAS
jgi:hypothetical protein